MADTFYFLNVGCADCTVIHLGGKVVMVDCHQGDSDEGQDDILKYLPGNHIDVLILTHAHRDHFGGIQVLLDNKVTVDEVWESNYERRREDNSVDYDEWQEYKDLVGRLGATVHQPVRSLSFFDSIGPASFQFYNPTSEVNSDAGRHIHDASLAFNILIDGKRIAFAGDASDKALQSTADYFALMPKELLHVSHHGSINGACADFIEKSNPTHCVISTKSDTHENVPHPTALQRYRASASGNVKRTDIDGTLTYAVD